MKKLEDLEIAEKPGFIKRLIFSGQLQKVIVYVISGGIAGALVFIGILCLLGIINPVYFGNTPFGTWYDFTIAGIIAFTGIYGFYEYYRIRRIRKIDERFPDFVRDLAESRRTGMTFTKAVLHASKGNYGMLTPEIQKMARQISWGSSVEDALASFAKRVNTKLIRRTVSLIIEASRSGGTVADVLDAASKDAREIKLLEKERKAGLMTYVITVYVGMFVFLAIIAIICITLLPSFLSTGKEAATSGMFGRSVTVQEFGQTFFTATLIQSACMGLVAGVFEEGEIKAGLKHMFVMILVSWIVFKFIGLGI